MNREKYRIVGIDASRNRSGGAKAHLIGLLKNLDPADFGIREVHVWTYRSLADALPELPWLVRHSPEPLQRGLLSQILWQVFRLPAEMRASGCEIMLNTDAGTLSFVRPCVTMSRDMLSYEPGEIERFGWSKARMRLWLLRYVQCWSMRRADGVVFLTRHAALVIQQHCGSLSSVRNIPHGVGEEFRHSPVSRGMVAGGRTSVRIAYVSNVSWYKHQWHVVDAVALLRDRGIDAVLTLIGGGRGAARDWLDAHLDRRDPNRRFVKVVEFVPNSELPGYLAEADIFVFASSCENMPNTLIEAMAFGLPIACSDRGPMPEVLQDGGELFDPEDPESIAGALMRLISDAELRNRHAARAYELAMAYSWKRCAAETFAFLVETLDRYTKAKGR